MKRPHRARRLALQGLCCLDAQGEGVMVLVRQFLADSRERPETISSALALMQGAFADHEHSDRLLKRHARHWELSRLALVDRNILRLAAHEMCSRSSPPKVIIAEAIRLAQEFSTAESPRFVNGVLDAIYRELRARQDAPGGAAEGAEKKD